MRGQLAIAFYLLVEAFAFGQGFNKRYDGFGWAIDHHLGGMAAMRIRIPLNAQ